MTDRNAGELSTGVVSVVDDDESVRESLPDLLKELGYAARAFSSAKDFLAADGLAQTPCLILDIAMPDMTGPDLQWALKRRGLQIPIVFITAHRDDTVRTRMLQQGAVECLFKPFSEAALVEALEPLIRCAGLQTEVFASARQFLARPRVVAPSCLVLDVTLPDLDGLELQRLIGVERLDMPIIFITGHGDVPMTVRAMKAGAVEFLTKPLDTELLLSAIRLAIERSRTALTQQAQLRALRERHTSLSAREQEVMALVVRGHLNKQIGGELGISEITVKAHRGKMMRKMQAKSLAQLVTMAGKLHT